MEHLLLIILIHLCYSTDPFDCSDHCHLAWLLRDNPRLLVSVYGAQCSNGTTFRALDPAGFKNCPVIKTK